MGTKDKNKINVFDYQSKKPTLLGRLVAWYKETSRLNRVLAPISTIALIFLATVYVSYVFFLLFIPAALLVPKILDLSRIYDQTKASEDFYSKIGDQIKEGKLTAPSNDPIYLKSQTQTFNHVNDYVIKDGIIWFRRSATQAAKAGQWRPVYFDSVQQDNKPVRILADGANLMVVDNQGNVHYRKVLIEARGYKEIHVKKKSRMDPHIGDFHLEKEDNDSYVAIDKTLKPNWKPNWYNFPLLNRLVNLYTGDRLHVKGPLALSHRGRFDEGYLDIEHHFHSSTIGVTTSYELENNGKEIIKHDPWVPTWAKVHFYFPENKKSAFIAKNIDVSASCLMVMGYEVDRETGQGKLKILTNFCDIDILGGNPLLNYAYQTEHISQKMIEFKDMRILPDTVKNEGWKELQLPNDIDVIYNQITVVQKWGGEREFRFAAKNKSGEVGFYYKNNTEGEQWMFTPSSSIDTSHVLKIDEKIAEALPEPLKDYNGTLQLKKRSAEVKVVHYGKRALHSEVKLKLDGNQYSLMLHKRWNLKTFLGNDAYNYDLVIPDNTPDADHKLENFFSQRRVLRVKVNTDKKVNEESISIMPK